MSNKRFVPIAEYQRMTGLSYATVMNMVKTNQVRSITTESGLRRIDTQDAGNTDAAVIAERLDAQERMLKALCCHLGVAQ